MEILIRWVCPCIPPRQFCVYCKGATFFERWVPLNLVQYIMGGNSYVIMDRRMVLTPQTGVA